MTLKNRITKLEKDNTPKSDVTMNLSWGDADETPAEKAKREADRPTHTPEGTPIRYIQLRWPDEGDD